MFTDQDMNQRELNEADFEKLKANCPELVKLLLNPELLKEPRISEKLNQETWQSVAISILDTLKKNKNAKIFLEPVNWQKMNLLDYPMIVKEPMDFSTIRKKLSFNTYTKIQEFIRDVSLIFSNCKLYNGVESFVGKMGVEMSKEWEALRKTYNLSEKYGSDINPFLLDKNCDLNSLFEETVHENKQKVKEDDEPIIRKTTVAPSISVSVQNPSAAPVPASLPNTSSNIEQ